jgi:hypothetical protein
MGLRLRGMINETTMMSCDGMKLVIHEMDTREICMKLGSGAEKDVTATAKSRGRSSERGQMEAQIHSGCSHQPLSLGIRAGFVVVVVGSYGRVTMCRIHLLQPAKRSRSLSVPHSRSSGRKMQQGPRGIVCSRSRLLSPSN